MMDGGDYSEQYEDQGQGFDNLDASVGNNVGDRFRHHDSGKLFVGGIAWETTRERFTDYFCKYGEVTDAIIMMDKFSGRPRGFGFVTFADPAVADKVLQEDHVMDGRAIEVKRTVPREEAPGRGVQKTRRIFVGGLIPSVTEDELKEYFSSFGQVVEHQIMFDHETGRSRGFGFVTFDNEEPVERILSDGSRVHELGGRSVEIKKALPKRFGGDYANEHGGGAVTKPYGGYKGGGANEYQGGYSGKMDNREYGDYNNYGGYAGNYGGGGAMGFYGGYGGYGYNGYGFWGPNMYGGYGNMYGGYGGGGFSGGGAAGFGGGKGYGAASKGYGSGGSATGRYHPYQK